MHQKLKSALQYFFVILSGTLGGVAFNLFNQFTPYIFTAILIMLSFGILGYLKKSYFNFYLFGIAFNTISLLWIGESFRFSSLLLGIDLTLFIPFVSFFLSLILAIHFPLSLYIEKITKLPWYFAFIIFEWIRSYFGIFFPWNCIAYTGEIWLSSVRFWGVFGLSFFMILTSQIAHFKNWFRSLVLLIAIILSVDNHVYKNALNDFTKHKIRIVQPCTNQSEIITQRNLENTLNKLINLSYTSEQVDAIIWPESALPKCLHSTPQICSWLRNFIPLNSHLILGHIHFANNQLYVAVSALDAQGTIVDTYDKQVLVPFGEYIPFKIPCKILPENFGFSAGACIKTFSLKNLPSFVPIICYEAIFPWILQKSTKTSWILHITNDGWFGSSIGPIQHLHIAKTRAIEQGKPVIRVSNNGISAIIGPQGKILSAIPLNTMKAINIALPQNYPRTWFNILGNISWILFILLMYYFRKKLLRK